MHLVSIGLQSALRRPEVHTFAWKIAIYTTYIGVTHVRVWRL